MTVTEEERHKSLQDLEGVDWGEPTFPSHLVFGTEKRPQKRGERQAKTAPLSRQTRYPRKRGREE